MKKYLKKHRKEIILFYTLTAVLAVLSVGNAFLIKKMTDVGTNKDMNLYFKVIALVVVYMIIEYSVHYKQQLETDRLAKVFSKDVACDIFTKITQFSISRFHKNTVGFYMAQLSSQIQLIERQYFYTVFWASYLICQFIVALISALVIFPKLILPVFAFSVPFIMLPLATKNRAAQAASEMSKQTDLTISFLQDLLNGESDWKIAHKEQTVGLLGNEHISLLLKTQTRQVVVTNRISICTKIFAQSLYYGIWLIGLYYVIQGQVSFATLLAFTRVSADMAFPLHQAIELYTQYTGGKAIYKKIAADFSINETSLPDKNTDALNQKLSLEYKNIYYKIDNRIILKNFSYHFDLTKKYLIIGESGAGKSTLVKLLLHQNTDYEGNISYRGCPMGDHCYEIFRKECAYVPQGGHIFEGSVLDNISLFDTSPDLSKITEVMTIAGLEKWLDEEYFFNRRLSETALSGGEKQRLLLARALYRSPLFLILDEVSSALDENTALELENRLLGLGIGFIYIAHKYSRHFERQVDAIVKLENVQS